MSAHDNTADNPTSAIRSEKILIIDFGSQYTQLIARRLRESSIYCEIHPCTRTTFETVKAFNPRGIILSGGPASVFMKDAPQLDMKILTMGLPVLGICYGFQLLMQHLGGEISPPVAAKESGHENAEGREFGKAFVTLARNSPLTEGLPRQKRAQVWMSHGDRVARLAPDFSVLASSTGAPVALVGDDKRRFYGTQFHPEVEHTLVGRRLLDNFARRICGCSGNWTMGAFVDQAIEDIKAQVGDNRVICALSGGVDSAVTAALIHRAIGDRLTCILVDHGLMRRNETSEILTLFRKEQPLQLIHCQAEDRFLKALHQVQDPEEKRKIIGRTFIELFEEEAKKLGDIKFLAQGTLYPDVIESVSSLGGPSVTIKSHHNVGGLPERMKLTLIEPLRDLFKDEVRRLGAELGIPPHILGRHPFPGPGLAIRIPGPVTREDCALLRQVDEIYIDEIRKAGLYDKIWQAFAVLLPVRSVGVMGDNRSYERVTALRAVTSTDGMTAEFYPFKPDFLNRTATRIVNEISGINRVVYDVTSKPPGTIEWE